MHWNSAKHFIFVTLVAAIVVLDVTALKCVSRTSCSCHLSDGSFYDLGKVSPDSVLKGNFSNYIFAFEPCKDVKINLGYEENATTICNSDPGVSLCIGNKVDPPFSLGTTSETNWNVPDNSEPELILTHGINTTRIALLCCKSCPLAIHLDGPLVPNQFHFTLQSPHVCKLEGPPEGLSTGSVLVILLFVFSGVYLLVGALALRFFRGAIGWELIPNYDFWSDLPALVRDGIAFTFSGCSVDSYDRI